MSEVRLGPKVSIFMRKFLIKLELCDDTYGMRGWMDFDLKFGKYYPPEDEMWLASLLDKNKYK